MNKKRKAQSEMAFFWNKLRRPLFNWSGDEESHHEDELAPVATDTNKSHTPETGFIELRLTIDQLVDNSGSVQLSLVNFYNDHGKIIKPKNVENPRGGSPYYEEPKNLINGNVNNKWLDFNYSHEQKSQLRFEFREAVCVQDYELVSANDCADRDPVSWKLEGLTRSNKIVLLDTRSGFEPPFKRFTSFGRLKLNFGNFTETHADTSSREETIIEHWTSSQPSKAFAAIENSICLNQIYMKTSNQQKILQDLYPHISSTPGKTWTPLLLTVIQKTYQLRSANQARNQRCTLEGYHLYNDINTLYESFDKNWRKGYIEAGLKVIFEREKDPTGLVGLLSLLARAGTECRSRKVMAFNTLIQCASSSKTLSAGVAENQQKEAMDRFLLSFVDTFKQKALAAAFLEPTKLILETSGDQFAVDVEVHGSNTYICTVMRALSMRYPVIPLFEDEVKGCCEFLETKNEINKKIFEELLSPRYFGMSWKSVPSSKSITQNRYRDAHTKGNQFISEFGDTPMNVAERIASNVKSQRKFEPYLRRFAKCFERELVVSKACDWIISEEGPPYPWVLTIFNELKQKNGTIDDDDFREWIYEEENDYKPNIEKATLFFEFLGLIRQIR
eukprot:TRINITY_DN12388_c0_g1_i1.p1 TRINITY_DN12388_c0_g1~~TRINITY_DN12388_c0_g1_i1.p1  ORF type:complete len:616 (-),score=122.41 TRINITY_DN12388_c0_g1_i1:97-1944(-)